MNQGLPAACIRVLVLFVAATLVAVLTVATPAGAVANASNADSLIRVRSRLVVERDQCSSGGERRTRQHPFRQAHRDEQRRISSTGHPPWSSRTTATGHSAAISRSSHETATRSGSSPSTTTPARTTLTCGSTPRPASARSTFACGLQHTAITSFSCADNAWPLVEMTGDYGSTTYTLDWKIDGVAQTPISSSGQTATTAKSLWIGNASAGQTNLSYWDDIRLDVTDSAPSFLGALPYSPPAGTATDSFNSGSFTSGQWNATNAAAVASGAHDNTHFAKLTANEQRRISQLAIHRGRAEPPLLGHSAAISRSSHETATRSGSSPSTTTPARTTLTCGSTPRPASARSTSRRPTPQSLPSRAPTTRAPRRDDRRLRIDDLHPRLEDRRRRPDAHLLVRPDRHHRQEPLDRQRLRRTNQPLLLGRHPTRGHRYLRTAVCRTRRFRGRRGGRNRLGRRLQLDADANPRLDGRCLYSRRRRNRSDRCNELGQMADRARGQSTSPRR